MTSQQKQLIDTMRRQGISFARIGEVLGISENTIKSCCQRNRLGRGRDEEASAIDNLARCRQCGEALKQITGRKTKIFCSDVCRMAWWNRHRHMIRGQAYIPHPCAHCGKSFRSYGKQQRKYCSHACYISSRYGVGHDQHV